MTAINMAEDSVEATARKAPTAAQLRSLSTFLDKQIALEDEIAIAAAELKRLETRHKKLTEVDIPGLFDQLGIGSMKLTDGRTVEVRKSVYASISEDNKPSAFAWLRSHELGSIIKTNVGVQFGAGMDELVLKTTEFLTKKLGDKASIKVLEAVHPSTLGATVRDILEKGKLAIPASITTTEIHKSIIKAAKK